METSFKIGMRNIKTSAAVFVCLVIGLIFGRDSFYSTIAAILCMQSTLSQTLEAGINRLLGTVIGGAAGFLLLELQDFMPSYNRWLYIIIIPLFIMLLIFLCNIVHIPGAIAMCCVVFLGIAIDFGREIPGTLFYVFSRVVDTSIGIGVAMLINRYRMPQQDAQQESDAAAEQPAVKEVQPKEADETAEPTTSPDDRESK